MEEIFNMILSTILTYFTFGIIVVFVYGLLGYYATSVLVSVFWPYYVVKSILGGLMRMANGSGYMIHTGIIKIVKWIKNLVVG